MDRTEPGELRSEHRVAALAHVDLAAVHHRHPGVGVGVDRLDLEGVEVEELAVELGQADHCSAPLAGLPAPAGPAGAAGAAPAAAGSCSSRRRTSISRLPSSLRSASISSA